MKYTRRILVVPDAEITPDVVKSAKVLSDSGGSQVLSDAQAKRAISQPIRGARYRHYQRENIEDTVTNGMAKSVTMVVDRVGDESGTSEPKLFRDDTIHQYKETPRSSHQFEPLGSQSARGAGELVPATSGEPGADFKGNLMVTSSGQTGTARFSWSKASEGRDGKTVPGDGQFRQSPNVFGSYSSVLHSTDGPDSAGGASLASNSATGSLETSTRYLCRPKMFELQNGEIGCVYLGTSLPPHHWVLASNRSLDGDSLGVTTDPLSCKVFFQKKSKSGEWSAPVELTNQETFSGLVYSSDDAKSGSEICFIDGVVDPETGDIVCVLGKNYPELLSENLYAESSYSGGGTRQVVSQSTFCSGKVASSRSLLTIVSSDNGSSWLRRSESSMDSDGATIFNDAVSTGVPGIPTSDVGLILGGSCELMKSGRLVISLVTGESIYLVSSDDMGFTFRGNKVKDISISADGDTIKGIIKKEPQEPFEDGDAWIVDSTTVTKIHGIFDNNPAPLRTLTHFNRTSPDGRSFVGANSDIDPDERGWELVVDELRDEPPTLSEISSKPGATGGLGNVVYSRLYAIGDNPTGAWSGAAGCFAIAFRSYTEASADSFSYGFMEYWGTGTGSSNRSVEYKTDYFPVTHSGEILTYLDSTDAFAFNDPESSSGRMSGHTPAGFSTGGAAWYWHIFRPGGGFQTSPDAHAGSRHFTGIHSPTPGRYFFVKSGQYAGRRIFIEGEKERDPSLPVVTAPPAHLVTPGDRVLVGPLPQGAFEHKFGYVAEKTASGWSFIKNVTKFIPDGNALIVVGNPRDTDSFAGRENEFVMLETLTSDLSGDNYTNSSKALLSTMIGSFSKFSIPDNGTTVIVSNKQVYAEDHLSDGGNQRDPGEARTRSQASDSTTAIPLVAVDGIWVEDEDLGDFVNHPGELARYNAQSNAWQFLLPADGYFARVEGGALYRFNRGANQWSIIEDEDSIPELVVARKTKAREIVANTSMTISDMGQVYFAVAYTDFFDISGISPMVNIWIQDDVLDTPSSAYNTYGTNTEYPFILEDPRTMIISYTGRRMEVYETTDGESSSLVDGWVNSTNVEDSSAFATNVAAYDGSLRYSVEKGMIVGTPSDLPYGPCVIEPCIVIRPDGMLQVYGASHNWLPPQYEGLQNDSLLNQYTSAVNGTSYGRGESMGPAVISAMASATIDVDSSKHNLKPNVNGVTSRNAVSYQDGVGDDQFTSAAIAISDNGLEQDSSIEDGSPNLRVRSHMRRFDTRRATAAYLANPISGGAGKGLIAPGLVQIKAVNGLTYTMSFVWGIYPKKPSVQTAQLSDIDGVTYATTAFGKTERLSNDLLSGVDFVAIDEVFVPPTEAKVGDVYLVKEPNAFGESPEGAFAGYGNYLASFDRKAGGTVGWSFRGRFSAGQRVWIRSLGTGSVRTADIDSSTSGPNILAWTRGLTIDANEEIFAGEYGTININGNFVVASLTPSSISNISYIAGFPNTGKSYIAVGASGFSNGHLGDHLVGCYAGYSTSSKFIIESVIQNTNTIVVSDPSGGLTFQAGVTLNIYGNGVTIGSLTTTSGSISDISEGDIMSSGSRTYYVADVQSSSFVVLDLELDLGITTTLSNTGQFSVLSPGSYAVGNANELSQNVYFHRPLTSEDPEQSRLAGSQYAGFICGYSGMDAISSGDGISVVSSKVYQPTLGNMTPSRFLCQPVVAPGGSGLATFTSDIATVGNHLVFKSGVNVLFVGKVELVEALNASMTVSVVDRFGMAPMSSASYSGVIMAHRSGSGDLLSLDDSFDAMQCKLSPTDFFGGKRDVSRSLSQYDILDASGADIGFRSADSSSITENKTFYWHPLRENLGRTDSASSVGGFSHWQETAMADSVYLNQESIYRREVKTFDIYNRRFRLIGGRYYAVNWFGDKSPEFAGFDVFKKSTFGDSSGHISIVDAGSVNSEKLTKLSASGIRQSRPYVSDGETFEFTRVYNSLRTAIKAPSGANETDVQIYDTVEQESGGNLIISTISSEARHDQTLPTGSIFGALVSPVIASDTYYSQFQDQVYVTLVFNSGYFGSDIQAGDAIRFGPDMPFFEISRVVDLGTIGVKVYIDVFMHTTYINFNGVQMPSIGFLPNTGALTAADVEIRPTVVFDYGYSSLTYTSESGTTLATPVMSYEIGNALSAGNIYPASPVQAVAGDYMMPNLPNGSQSGNMYEITQAPENLQIRIDNADISLNAANGISTIQASLANPGGVFVITENLLNWSSSTYDSATGQTTLSGVTWEYNDAWNLVEVGKIISGSNTSGSSAVSRAYEIVATDGTSSITVQGNTDANSEITSSSAFLHDEFVAGDEFIGEDSGRIFEVVSMSFQSGADTIVLVIQNHNGVSADVDDFMFDRESNKLIVETTSNTGSRLLDEQTGFSFNIYTSKVVSQLGFAAQNNGGALVYTTEGTHSILAMGVREDGNGVPIGNRLPFPEGFGCAPIHDGLGESHHADPFAGGFRAIFAPFNDNEDIITDSFGLTTNLFFSMLLRGSAWSGYRNGTTTDKSAGVMARCKLSTESDHKKVIIEVINGGEELNPAVTGGSTILGTTEIRFDLNQDLCFVELIVGCESGTSVQNPDTAPLASIVHAFARRVDSFGNSNEPFQTICNYRRLEHVSRFTNIIQDTVSQYVNTGREHFMFGTAFHGVKNQTAALPNDSIMGMVVKQVSVHRPGNAISGSGMIALNSDLDRTIETISAPIYDKAAYGTQFTELQGVQVSDGSQSGFTVGDLYTRGNLLGLNESGVNPASLMMDGDACVSLMEKPYFNGSFGAESSRVDAGVVNPNRTALALPSEQEIYKGIKVSWSGTSATKACYAISTYYHYAFQNAFEQSLSKYWRTGISPENSLMDSRFHSGKQQSGRDYRSRCKVYTVPSVEIVLDSQGDGGDASSGDLVLDVDYQIRQRKNFVPDGIAVFGRNWSGCTIEFCDSPSFSSSSGSYRSYTIGQPGDSWLADPSSTDLDGDPKLYSHLWAWTNRADGRQSPERQPASDGTGGSHVKFGDNTFSYVYDTSNKSLSDENTPWIPHQFRSTDTSGAFYLQVVSSRENSSSYSKTANRLIFKIKDNDANTLFLDSNPLRVLDASPSTNIVSGSSSMPWHTVSIFSDRFAAQLYNYSNTTSASSSSQTKPDGQQHHLAGGGFRYMKITIDGGSRLIQDEAVHKLGRIVVGAVKNLSGPDFDWGWSRKEQSGTNITTFAGGQRVARKAHEPRRVFEVSHSPLMPKNTMHGDSPVWEATSRGFGGGSGEFQDGSLRTWNETVDLVRSLGLGYVQAALVFDDASSAVASSEGDNIFSYSSSIDECKTVAVPSDPQSLMLVRMVSVGEVGHEGYVCRDVMVQHGAFKDSMSTPGAFGVKVSRPSPAMTIAQMVFEEEI